MADKILVLDSCSEDQSYMKELYNFDNTILFAEENKNFIDSAVWFAYHTFPDEEHYFVLHDSMEIHKSLECFKENDFTSFMYFRVDKSLLQAGRGWHNQQMKYKAKFELESKTTFKFMEEFVGLMGITFIARRKILTELHTKGLQNILPTNKEGMCTSERIWGMCLNQIGIDITKNTIAGEDRKQSNPMIFKTEYITKHILDRK